MATVDLSTSDQVVDMTDPGLVTFGTREAATSTGWSWLTPTGNDLQLDGSGMTFDAQGRALTGTVNTIGIDLGNDDFANPEIVITGINAPAASLDDGPQSFWRFLEGNDTIIGPTAGSSSGTENLIFGDGPAARAGATGGNDWIDVQTGWSIAAGDVWTAGTSSATAPKLAYRGGNDTLVGQVTDAVQTLIGDVFEVDTSGNFTGGNDTILLQSLNDGSAAIGDAYTVNGGASVTGGNDTITLGSGSFASLVGDVMYQEDTSFVRGGNDLINGNSQGNTLIGDVYNVGNGRLVGGADIMFGGDGGDIMLGDFAIVNALGQVTAGNDTLHGGAGSDHLYGDSSVTTNTTGGDDRLYGDAGDDVLEGGNGNDLLDGGAGNDGSYGGAGNDTYVADTAYDLLHMYEDAGAGIDTVKTTVKSAVLAANFENLTFTGTGSFIGKGNELGNVIRGGTGPDDLDGMAGNDVLYGGYNADVLFGDTGNDTLNGGEGGDTMNGAEGFDTASYAGSEQGVTVSLDGSLTVTGDALGDTLFNIEGLTGTDFNDVLRGDANANVLTGGKGGDVLYGMAGADTIRGGEGADSIYGGLGNDRFDFFAMTDAGDRVRDFANAADNNDTLRFLGSAFGNLARGELSANHFAANTTGVAADADDRFIYETDTGILRFDANGSAAGGVTTIAVLTGAPALTAGDFYIL